MVMVAACCGASRHWIYDHGSCPHDWYACDTLCRSSIWAACSKIGAAAQLQSFTHDRVNRAGGGSDGRSCLINIPVVREGFNRDFTKSWCFSEVSEGESSPCLEHCGARYPSDRHCATFKALTRKSVDLRDVYDVPREPITYEIIGRHAKPRLFCTFHQNPVYCVKTPGFPKNPNFWSEMLDMLTFWQNLALAFILDNNQTDAFQIY